MLIVLQVTATFKLSFQIHFKVQSRFTYQYQVHVQNKKQIQYKFSAISLVFNITYSLQILFRGDPSNVTFLRDISQVQTEEIRRVSLRRPVQRLGAPREDTAALDDRKL